MPKRVYQPSKTRRRRGYSFRHRSKNIKGKRVLSRRRRKGRKKISV